MGRTPLPAPLLLLNALFAAERASSLLAMPLFIAGLASMFVSLPLFHRYKHGLIATEKALDTPDEPAAWLALARIRRLAFVGAALPAWIAALAVFACLLDAIEGLAHGAVTDGVDMHQPATGVDGADQFTEVFGVDQQFAAFA